MAVQGGLMSPGRPPVGIGSLGVRSCLCLAACGSITLLTFALGRDSGAHRLLLASALYCLTLFDWNRERRAALAGLALHSALFLGYEASGHRLGAMYPPAPDAEPWLRLAISLATLIAILLGVLHFVIGMARAERELAAAQEEAQAADRLRTRFLANMSHEVRTPLNAILGLAQFLEYPDSQPNRKELLQGIRASAGELLSLFEGMIGLSEMEAGETRLDSVPFRVRGLAESVLADFRIQASQNRLSLRFEAEALPSETYLGNPTRLRQILTLLLSNAIKLASEGSITLRIRSDGGQAARPLIRFEVSDTGAGMAEDAQGSLFQPFRQTDGDATHGSRGAGLGLVLCKRLVDKMAGTFSLTGRPGSGTTVAFAVPLEVPDKPGIPAPETVRGSAGHSGVLPAGRKAGEARILIVDDRPLNRMVLKCMLARHGLSADEAFDGAQALDAFARRPYDLILMDCRMPVMDGIECAWHIRSQGGRRPLILGITADSLPETRRDCLEAGMNDVLLKPIDEDELRISLLPLLPGKSAGEAETPADPAPQASEWVDVRRLNRLLQETRLRDSEHRKQAFLKFEAEARALRQDLGTAAGTGGIRQLKDTAHGLKGLCRTLGLDRLAKACDRIEAAALSEDSPDWSPALTDLDQAFEPSLADLRRVLKV